MKNNICGPAAGKHPCTGCGICAAVCPQNAITIRVNNEGFYFPQVNQDICLSCGLCINSCYKCDEKILLTSNKGEIDVYAAYSKDSKILSDSSSGGVADRLVKVCIDKGFLVSGVSYDTERNIALSRIVDNYEEGNVFRGSKYMQAYTLDSLKRIIQSDGETKFCIFGTPCQIYGIYKWAKNANQRERFIFIDFFCHGCPSLFLWWKYLEYYKSKLNTLQLQTIQFRCKDRGWHEYCHSFQGNEKKIISRKTIFDPFFNIFFDDQVLARSCYSCQLRSTYDYTDLRLGDFWGNEHDFNIKGVSSVLAITERGKELFEMAKPLLFVNKSSLEKVEKYQLPRKERKYNPEIRNTLLSLLASTETMDRIFNYYLNFYNPKKKTKRIIKIVISFLPQLTRNFIRKCYHLFLDY